MNTNNKYGAIIKRFLILLALLFISPILLSISLKALKIYTENKIIIAYLLLVISVVLIIYTVFYGFKTFKKLLDIIFEDE